MLLQSGRFCSFLIYVTSLGPEGHSATNEALGCHAGGWGSNPDTTMDFKCSYPLRYNVTSNLSFSQLLGVTLKTRDLKGIAVKILLPHLRVSYIFVVLDQLLGLYFCTVQSHSLGPQ